MWCLGTDHPIDVCSTYVSAGQPLWNDSSCKYILSVGPHKNKMLVPRPTAHGDYHFPPDAVRTTQVAVPRYGSNRSERNASLRPTATLQRHALQSGSSYDFGSIYGCGNSLKDR